MLAIVFSDVQVNSYKQHNTDNCRLLNCLKAVNEVFSFAAKKGIKYILFSGDLYDTQKILGTEVVNETVDLFLSWGKSNPEIKFLAISGNHDHATKNLLHKPAVTGLTHLAHACSNFYLVDNSLFKLPELDCAVWGIPYYEREEDFAEALVTLVEQVKSLKYEQNILMVHQTPNNMGNDTIPADLDINDPAFDLFNFVYCGHIHQHALLSTKFMLVGSPLHRTLEDLGSDKGFIVTDISNPTAGYKFISLNSKLPVFRVLQHDEVILPEWQKDYIEKLPIPIVSKSIEGIVDKFKADLTPTTLLTNYWERLGEGDTELLKVGLSLLK